MPFHVIAKADILCIVDFKCKSYKYICFLLPFIHELYVYYVLLPGIIEATYITVGTAAGVPAEASDTPQTA